MVTSPPIAILEGDAPSAPFPENPTVPWCLRERKSLRTQLYRSCIADASR